MIYVCAVAHDQATTVGLALWKVRQVFSAFPREFHFLVAHDGSADSTGEVLESYQRVLPLSLTRHAARQGYAVALEALLRDAVARSDRPKRDIAVTIHADFEVSPDVLPVLVRAMESGADLAVAEAPDAEGSLSQRLVRRAAPWLLRPGIRVPGIRDLLSGVCAVRLSTLRLALNGTGTRMLTARGLPARAELVARNASVARQIAAVPVPPHAHAAAPRAPESALALALALFRAGRQLRVPPPSVEVHRPADQPRGPAPAEVAQEA